MKSLWQHISSGAGADARRTHRPATICCGEELAGPVSHKPTRRFRRLGILGVDCLRVHALLPTGANRDRRGVADSNYSPIDTSGNAPVTLLHILPSGIDTPEKMSPVENGPQSRLTFFRVGAAGSINLRPVFGTTGADAVWPHRPDRICCGGLLAGTVIHSTARLLRRIDGLRKRVLSSQAGADNRNLKRAASNRCLTKENLATLALFISLPRAGSLASGRTTPRSRVLFIGTASASSGVRLHNSYFRLVNDLTSECNIIQATRPRPSYPLTVAGVATTDSFSFRFSSFPEPERLTSTVTVPATGFPRFFCSYHGASDIYTDAATSLNSSFCVKLRHQAASVFLSPPQCPVVNLQPHSICSDGWNCVGAWAGDFSKWTGGAALRSGKLCDATRRRSVHSGEPVPWAHGAGRPFSNYRRSHVSRHEQWDWLHGNFSGQSAPENGGCGRSSPLGSNDSGAALAVQTARPFRLFGISGATYPNKQICHNALSDDAA